VQTWYSSWTSEERRLVAKGVGPSKNGASRRGSRAEAKITWSEARMSVAEKLVVEVTVKKHERTHPKTDDQLRSDARGALPCVFARGPLPIRLRISAARPWCTQLAMVAGWFACEVVEFDVEGMPRSRPIERRQPQPSRRLSLRYEIGNRNLP